MYKHIPMYKYCCMFINKHTKVGNFIFYCITGLQEGKSNRTADSWGFFLCSTVVTIKGFCLSVPPPPPRIKACCSHPLRPHNTRSPGGGKVNSRLDEGDRLQHPSQSPSLFHASVILWELVSRLCDTVG